MVHSIPLFVYRKPGTTPEQFQAYYEEKHIKLIKELAGDDFLVSHTRRYVHRTRGKGDTERNTDYPATVFLGEQADFDYDCCSGLIFSDSAALYAFKETLAQAENATRIAADEGNFIDRSKLLIVGLGQTRTTMKRV
ncbi:EthD domain-containing protein [Xylaria digitata]|nr:EthD domain-containing protein [Xylaria digitata]